MKVKVILLMLLSASSLSALAQLNGNGYYRARNYYTQRYMYVVDNRGSINYITTDADMAAIDLDMEKDKQISDPSCVVYISAKGNNQYNVSGQGTSIYDIISYYVTISKASGTGSTTTYFFTASKSGITKTLCDGDADLDYQRSKLSTTTTKGTIRNWEILPINSSDDSYFGIKPDIEIDGKYYKSFYASFPFKVKSSGMKVYYASALTDGNLSVTVAEVASDAVIPASTPVFIECSSANPSDNRIDIVDQVGTAISGNILKGNYFCYDDEWYPIHKNVLVNNPSTMRVLGKKDNGMLGFITSTDQYIPANSSYIVVPEGSSPVLSLNGAITGISSVKVDDQQSSSAVYSLQGIKVAEDINSASLPSGVYIVGGKKVIVK